MTSYDKQKEAESNYNLMSNEPVSPIGKDAEKAKVDETTERGNWSNQLDFIMSCVSYAVGLGNIWRFPYLCYSNGGGAFLIPYVIMLLFAGMPLFFLELSFGQYSSRGPISVWQSVPLLRGVGYGMVVTSGVVAIYYNVIITYTIFYMIKSLTRQLPWSTCDNEWNTDYCSLKYENCRNDRGIMNDTMCIYIDDMNDTELLQFNITDRNDTSNYVDPWSDMRVRPSEEYYRNGVLHDSKDIGNFGYIVWQLALCLLLAWTIVCVCLWKGVKSSGKVVYFTAIFPYVVLFILLIRGLTLEGHEKGIEFFIKPKWELLANPKVWKDAAVQIFFSLSASWGGLITLSSYNKFKNNCMRDAMIVPILNCATSIFAGFVIFSILGYMAHALNKEVSEVVEEQFGLAFIAYPEAVASLPFSPVWSFLFFFMLITLGFGSQFCIVETVVTSIVDEFPQYLRKRKTVVLVGYCSIAFLFGLLCVTQAGNYWVILIDKYAADIALLVFGLCECIGLGWLYGAKRFMNDIRTMVGDRIVDHPLFKWWPLNWCALTPAVLSFVMLFSFISWSLPTAGHYEYPGWAHCIGWMLVVLSLMWIPIVMIYEVFVKGEKSPEQSRLQRAITARAAWGPVIPEFRQEAAEIHKRHGTSFGGDPNWSESNEISMKYIPAKLDENV